MRCYVLPKLITLEYYGDFDHILLCLVSKLSLLLQMKTGFVVYCREQKDL